MGEIGRAAQHLVRHTVFGCEIVISLPQAKCPPNRFDGFRSRPLVKADAHPGFADTAQVDPLIHRRFHHSRLQGADVDSDRVEINFRIDLEPGTLQPLGQTHGLAVNTLGNRLKAFWPVEHRIHRRHHRQQSLRRAHVRGRLFAADVLLAGLQGQTVGAVAMRID